MHLLIFTPQRGPTLKGSGLGHPKTPLKRITLPLGHLKNQYKRTSAKKKSIIIKQKYYELHSLYFFICYCISVFYLFESEHERSLPPCHWLFKELQECACLRLGVRQNPWSDERPVGPRSIVLSFGISACFELRLRHDVLQYI